jgi:choline-sulfatase
MSHSRRHVLGGLAAGSVGGCIGQSTDEGGGGRTDASGDAATATQHEAVGSAPNVLVLETDDHHPDAIGTVTDLLETPNLDRLASQGVRFDSHVPQGVACVPSRASLVTGSYPHNTGVYGNHADPMDFDRWMFPRALQRAGYHTSLQGKNHFKLPSEYNSSDKDDPTALEGWRSMGFDHVQAVHGKVAAAGVFGDRGGPYRQYLREQGLLSELESFYEEHRSPDLPAGKNSFVEPVPFDAEHYHDTFIARQAADWLRSYDREDPFFAWVNFVAPHPPMDAPEPYASMYDPADVPMPIGGVDEDDPWTEAEIREIRAGYYAMISLFDDQVSRLWHALEATGQLENTVIVVTGDQGSMIGDYGSWGKGTFHRTGLNSPLIVRWPEQFRQGAVVDRPVEMIDLVATFLELAGASDADRARPYGHSLLPHLTGMGSYDGGPAFSEQQNRAVVVTDRYKFSTGSDREDPHLYDLQADPEELNDLAGDRPDVESRLRDRIETWRRETTDEAA